VRNRLGLPAIVIIISGIIVSSMGAGAKAALAQSAELDEAVGPHGAVLQKHALTPGQKNAIYNAISRQKLRSPADRIAAAVDAPVPPSAELLDWPDLPDQAARDIVLDVSSPAVLKYAFVENQVVVVDPIAMRVVDVIRGSARP
jgi:hypothetical protein